MVTTPSEPDETGPSTAVERPEPAAHTAEMPVVPDEPVLTVSPRPVIVGFWLLVVSAVIKLFFGVLYLANWNSMLDQAMRNPPPNTSPDALRSYVHALLTVNVTLDLGLGVLFVLFALLVRQGRNWARITLTVVAVLLAMFNLVSGADLFTVVDLLLDLVGVGMLYVRTAKPWFGRGTA